MLDLFIILCITIGSIGGLYFLRWLIKDQKEMNEYEEKVTEIERNWRRSNRYKC